MGEPSKWELPTQRNTGNKIIHVQITELTEINVTLFLNELKIRQKT
jgi:hypothetical protein